MGHNKLLLASAGQFLSPSPASTEQRSKCSPDGTVWLFLGSVKVGLVQERWAWCRKDWLQEGPGRLGAIFGLYSQKKKQN